MIVGGGAVGAACARELARTGRRVLVVERGAAQGEGWRAAAGMLAPQIEARADDPLLELGLAGRELYHHLAGPLRESTGIDIGLRQCGILRVAGTEAEADELWSKVGWQRQQGYLCDWLDEAEVRAEWRWVGPTRGALWAPREGVLDPGRLVAALLADARAAGAVVVHDTIRALDRRGDRIVGVLGAERHVGDQVVIAAGAWSGRIDGLPRPLSVEPIRGQMLALPWPADVEPAIVFGSQCYVVARGGEALAGSTMEHAGFAAEVTSAGLARIFNAASALVPALAGAEVCRTWAGLRPMTPDGLPIIGREPLVEGLWYATGHGRNGILLAGITGVLLRQLMDGETPEEELDGFRPERFWRW